MSDAAIVVTNGRAVVVDAFRVEHARENATEVVRFIGELDIAFAQQAEEAGIAALSELAADAALVIDVSELAFCDSFGLRALLHIRAKATAAGHDVTLRRPSATLRQLLQLTDIRGEFSVEE